jgi:hypothetical protein
MFGSTDHLPPSDAGATAAATIISASAEAGAISVGGSGGSGGGFEASSARGGDGGFKRRSRPSEGQLADEFVHRHHRELGYLAAAKGRKAGWIVWRDRKWQVDRTHVALRLAREVCAEAACDCRHCQSNFPAVLAAVGLGHEQPVPIFQQLARSDPVWS